MFQLDITEKVLVNIEKDLSNWSHAYCTVTLKHYQSTISQLLLNGSFISSLFSLSMSVMHTTFPEAHKKQQQTCKIFRMVFIWLAQAGWYKQALWVTQQRDFLPHSRRQCCLVHTIRKASTSYSVGGQRQQGKPSIY